MDERYTPILSDAERAALRARRTARRKAARKARRRRRLRRLLPAGAVLLLLACLLTLWPSCSPEEAPEQKSVLPAVAAQVTPVTPAPPEPLWSPKATANTVLLDDTLPSAYAVVIDSASGEILAEKDSDAVISPASMTKLMTLLVAVENLKNLDDTVTITADITDLCYVNDCSVVGYKVGETASVRELLYGTILPSGADAALALAVYVSGSHEAFVDLMNEKAEALGIRDTTHFTNCVGLYDEAHHCTVRDMAVILHAAMENELCREVLNARTYLTAPTPEHPDGQVLSNWFLRRIEDKDTGGLDIIGAKTGYVTQSGSCAASCGRRADGREYLCVTGNAYSAWRAIYDHAELYKTYCS